MADGNIKVSVERVIHDAIRAVLVNAATEHGLCIESVDVNWLQIQSIGGPSAWAIDSIRIKTADQG